MTEYGAVIVAAGISSRMGAFKPLLPIGTQSMIQRTIRTVQEAGAEPVVVVAGYGYETIVGHLADSGVIIVQNKDYIRTKMLDSILIGLDYLQYKCRRVFISPADVPLVQPGTMKKIKGQAGGFIRPTYRGEAGHPVLMDMELLPVLKDWSGPGGLNGAVEAGYIVAGDVKTDDPGIVMDADTREEYEKLLRREMQLDSGKRKLRMELELRLGMDEVFFCSATAQFLELIDNIGSVNVVCEAMHMPCAEGWEILKRIQSKLGYAIVERLDGAEGEHYRLTEKGRWFLNAYQGMNVEMLQKADAAFHRYFTGNLETCE